MSAPAKLKRLEFLEKPGANAQGKAALRLWLRMLSCTIVIEKTVRARLVEDFGATLPRFDVMAALDRSPEGLLMGALSASLMVSNGNVTGVVDRLAAEGLVHKRQDEKDRRAIWVRLTPAGRKAFARMAKQHEAWIEDAFSGLSQTDIETLLGLLGRARASVEASGVVQATRRA